MKRLIDIVCSSCGWKGLDQWLPAGEYPRCSDCGASTERLWSKPSGVIGDDIPGGLHMEHVAP